MCACVCEREYMCVKVYVCLCGVFIISQNILLTISFCLQDG